MRKNKKLTKIVFIVFLLSIAVIFTFCKKNKNLPENKKNNLQKEKKQEQVLKQENYSDEEVVENLLFDQDIFFNINESPDYYLDNPDFNYNVISPEHQDKDEPDKYIFVENDEISIYFYLDYFEIGYTKWTQNEIYKFQFATIKKKTDKYFFGKYIGLTSDEIISEYPNYNNKKNYTIEKTGEGHIMYSSYKSEKIINFTLIDDIVDHIFFGYEP
jgi:hypothetical protein